MAGRATERALTSGQSASPATIWGMQGIERALLSIVIIGSSFRRIGRTSWLAEGGDSNRFHNGYRHTLDDVNERSRITIDMCIGGRDLTEPRLSPSGGNVAYVARDADGSALIVITLAGGHEIRFADPPPAAGRGFGGGCFDWLPDGSGLVYVATDGNLWLHLLVGDGPVQISRVSEGSHCTAPACSGQSVAAIIDEAEVWLWPIGDSADRAEPTRLDDGSADFVFDPYPLPSVLGQGFNWIAWNVPAMPWDSSRVQMAMINPDGISHDEFHPTSAVQQPRHLYDGRSLCVRDDTGWLNLWIGDEPLLDEPFEHAQPPWGMGQRSFASSPDGSQVAFTRNESGFGRLCVVDIDSRNVTEIARGVHGQLSWRGESLVALRSGARTPSQIVRYETTTLDRQVLVVGPSPAWAGVDLPEPEVITCASDDGILHARRYVAGEGRTICWIHGGPTDQWQVGFLPRITYWWSRGWDVLVVDPSGTTGHGRRFQQALQGRWGDLDVADTATILRASHESGASDPARTVVMGGSSGGLTALGIVGLHHGLVAGAVTLYPVTDIALLAEASHRFEAHYALGLVGPATDTDLYHARSPVSYADRIDVPVLIMHGDADPIVPLYSSVDFAMRLRAAGGDVDLVIVEDEGHGFRHPTNKRLEYERIEQFLSRVVDSA
jgi:dipeptidyl aminopeptidase/acylaminoacyl peptidase